MTEPLPLDRTSPLRGRDLRHACLVVLARSRPLTLTELLAVLTEAGFTVAGEDPRKVLSDRLRYEERRGRVRRVSRGRYGIGRVAPTTAWRMRKRWDQSIRYVDPSW
jgi:hypothetical protein